ncbi:MAG: hypothetical protein AAB446_00385 [Patescibacteria group bacterium]
MNKKFKNIVIANDTEAFESIINTINDRSKKAVKINKEHFLSSRFLFWEGDNKIVITPFPVEQPILSQAKSIGYKNIENWYPSKIGISLSDAIIKDSVLFDKLKKIIKNNPGIILSSYCYTKKLANLINVLKKENLKFHVDQLPKDKLEWLVGYLGSKVGFRLEMNKLKEIPKPKSFISESKAGIVKSAIWFYKQNKSCVVKAYSGEGGWGVLIIHKNVIFSETDLRKKLRKIFSKDAIWDTGPYVVEEFIYSSDGDENSPSLEVFIDDKGSEITYMCDQIVDPSGAFLGILMGKECLRADTIEKMSKIGNIIGNQYSRLGYRGFFDIDFIISKDGILYPIETNVRRTGGTHVFDLTKKLFGKDWANKTVALSKDLFCYGDKVLLAKEVLNKMSEIIFPIKGKKKGVVVVAVNSHEPYFSFVIFAPNKLDVLDINKKLTSIWNDGTLDVQ